MGSTHLNFDATKIAAGNFSYFLLRQNKLGPEKDSDKKSKAARAWSLHQAMFSFILVCL